MASGAEMQGTMDGSVDKIEIKAKRGRTLKEAVYGSLKAMILIGELQPGSRLTESALAERLKVSRTPLREALNRLERDGLVTNRPRHGYFVAAFDLKTFEESFGIREVLDGYAAQQAAERATAEDKVRLRAILARGHALARRPERPMEQMVEQLQLGLELHHVIAEVSGSGQLKDALSRILDRCHHFVWMELLWLDQWSAAHEEHVEIVDAICSGDGVRAGDLARRHVRGSGNNIRRLLQARSAYKSALARVS
ncbi:GntR family transcriptional regulator [Hypericibacter terrae]|uniref:GntR family transcriptional regulator n=1 Tax=Hypericibacter terrae TaxID=2602015 RepID=A0A5J6MHT6_9PROT|nr:GntR family transcriptional regulator [Hypericibacter terrae]QEX16651.1 GntR family transcriptional regulator [Hypericibacter terrae]